MGTAYADVTGCTVLVIAKECLPGKVKTRLTPPLSPTQAADLAAASLADTLAVVSGLAVRRRVLAFEGNPPAPAGDFDVIPQARGGLDQRIAAAFAPCDGPTLLLGMDTPQISLGLIAPVLREMDATPDTPDGTAWLGPAVDGGFWALGFSRPRPELVAGVPMSRSDTGLHMRERLIGAGMTVVGLPTLTDVDTLSDAYAVAAQAPGGRFAEAVDRLPDGLRGRHASPAPRRKDEFFGRPLRASARRRRRRPVPAAGGRGRRRPGRSAGDLSVVCAGERRR